MLFVFNHCYHQKWHAYKQNRDISVNHSTNIINFDLFTNFLLLLFIKYLWFFSCLGCFSFWTNILKLVHLLGLLLHWYTLVSLDRWCTEIGFYIVILILGSALNSLLKIASLRLSKFLYVNLLLQYDNTERNPGPVNTRVKNFSSCHWNVNSLVTDNYSKFCQPEA